MQVSAIGRLFETIPKEGNSCIVLCRSARAANLVKLALMKMSIGQGLLGTEVLSLNTYIAGLARMMGKEGQVIGSLGREMIISDILAAKDRKGYVGIAGKTALSEYVMGFKDAISELKKNSVHPDELSRKTDSDKVKRLLTEVYIDYEKKLKEFSALDTYDLIREIIRGAENDYQNHLSKSQLIAFCLDNDTATGEIVQAIKATSCETCVNQEIAYPLRSQVVVLSARQGERLAREVARVIKREHIKKCIPYNRICIVVPRGESYSRSVTAALDWAGIPSTEPLWENLSEHPLGAALILLLRLISLSNTKIDILKYCTSPYFGLNDSNRISELKRMERVIGTLLKLETWADIKRLSSRFRVPEEDSDYCSECLNILYTWICNINEWIKENKKESSWAEYCQKLRHLIKDTFKLSADENQEPTLAALEQKALEGLLEILDKIESAYSLIKEKDAKTDWESFAFTLSEAIRKKRLMKKGASRLGVAVVEPEDARGLDFDITVIFEATEDNYPSILSSNWLLNSIDRKTIGSGVEVLDTERQMKEDKKAFIEVINSSIVQTIFAVPSIGVDERQINRSIWVEEVIENQVGAGKEIEYCNIPRKRPSPKLASECLREAELDLAKKDAEFENEGKYYGFKALESANKASQKRLTDVSSMLIKQDYCWTPSNINTYLKCTLRAVLPFLLGIWEKDEFEETVSAKSKGTLMHSAAKQIVDTITKCREDGKPLEAAEEALTSIIDDSLSYTKSFKYVDTSEELWEIMAANVKPALDQFAKEEAAYLYGPGREFKPAFTEKSLITDEIESAMLRLKEIEIAYSVKIDRIDVNGKNECVVYDYKSGSLPKPKEDAQIEFYTLLCRQILGYEPVASLYIGLKVNAGKTIRDASRRGFLIRDYEKALGYVRNIQKTDPDKEDSCSLLAIEKSQLDERLGKSEGKLHDVVHSIKKGLFLKSINPSERSCAYCPRRNFCWALRTGTAAEAEEGAGDEGC